MKLYITIISVLSFFLTGCTTISDQNHSAYLPDAAELNYQLGLAYLNQHNWTRAEDRLTLANQQNPDSIVILDALAYLFQKTGRINTAYQYYKKTIRSQPKNAEFLNHFGAFLCQQGDYMQGIATLKNAQLYAKVNHSKAIEQNLFICTALLKEKES